MRRLKAVGFLLTVLALFLPASVIVGRGLIRSAAPVPPPAYAHFPPERGTYQVVVLEVLDGDTVRLGHIVPFVSRLHGINAPEKDTEAGKDARLYLQSLLPVGSMPTAELKGREKYGRLLATIRFGDRDVGHAMLMAGRARAWDGKGPRP